MKKYVWELERVFSDVLQKGEGMIEAEERSSLLVRSTFQTELPASTRKEETEYWGPESARR